MASSDSNKAVSAGNVKEFYKDIDETLRKEVLFAGHPGNIGTRGFVGSTDDYESFYIEWASENSARTVTIPSTAEHFNQSGTLPSDNGHCINVLRFSGGFAMQKHGSGIDMPTRIVGIRKSTGGGREFLEALRALIEGVE